MPVLEVQEDIRQGMRKIDIDIHNRVAMRLLMTPKSKEFDLCKCIAAAMTAPRALCGSDRRRLTG